jgi:dCTP diphosphatase
MVEEQLLEALLAFRREREWESFHSPRNLAISLSLEAAELLENFQWAREEDDVEEAVQERNDRISEEVADLAIYLTYLCHDLGIDLDRAIREKLAVNAARYPLEKSRGRSTKHGDL